MTQPTETKKPFPTFLKWVQMSFWDFHCSLPHWKQKQKVEEYEKEKKLYEK